jgi:hypothetical protein
MAPNSGGQPNKESQHEFTVASTRSAGNGGAVSLVGTGRWPSRGHCCGPDTRIRSTAYVTLRGQRFLHNHAAAHADRGENHDPTRASHCRHRIEREGLTREPAIREQCSVK